MLCLMNPQAALTMRNFCVENCAMPGLAVAASLQLMEKSHQPKEGVKDREESVDVIPFITSLLMGSDSGIRNWISTYIKSGQKRRQEASPSTLMVLRKYLLEQLINLTPKGSLNMEESKTVAASSLLRLYCALKGIATMKYSDEETGCLLRLVISHPPPSRAGTHFISLGICTLISSPGLLRSSDEEQQIVSWFRWLMTSESHFEKHSNKTDSPGEILFLLGLNFHNNQTQSITDLVCNTLGMKISVKTSALVRIRQIFITELFTESVVAAHAVKIPVTPKLDAMSTGYLPVHSILQLLKSRVFSKHKVSVKKWVYRQICNSAFPLHPLLPQLIESYVNSVIPKSAKPEHTNEPISEEEILALFESKKKTENLASSAVSRKRKKGAKDSQDKEGKLETTPEVQERQLCAQLLILYYLLLYEDLYQAHKKLIDVTKLSLYSDTVVSQIPISYLVQEALKHQNNCQNLFPPMIKLLSTHFPHLCLVEDWLDAHVGLMSKDKVASRSRKVPASLKITNVKEVISKCQSHPSHAIQLLEDLFLCTDVNVLKDCQDNVLSAIPDLLEEDTPRRLQDLMKKVWFKLHSLTPRRLRLNTVNALQPKTVSGTTPSQLAEQDLVIDPLSVLRCDDRVFRCPPVLEILLRILSAYTQACRVYLSSHVVDAVTAEKEKDRQELKVALLAAQESAIVQILLEVCLPQENEMRQAHQELSNLREVRCMMFSYIHQVFIADPSLTKLIHFQGYPSELIPLVVAGVPSMHICLDFIPELLGQPQRSKQIFGIQLLAHLCKQYHLPKSMNIAKLGIDVMFTLLSVLEKKEFVSFFRQTIPSLLFMCTAFPPLCDDATALLHQLGRVCYSQMSVDGSTCSASATDDTAKTQLEHGDHDALYHTIQATFNQICGKALVLGKLY